MASDHRPSPASPRTLVVFAGGPKVLWSAARNARPGDRVIVVGAAQLRAVPLMTEGAQMDPSDLQRRRDDLADAAAFLAEHGIDADSTFVQGDPAAVLVRAAEQHHADLVIVAYERRGLLEHLLGPVSDRVAHRVRCDVLVVH
jgi:nucleotide-binding universal stress UspA family protein